MFPVPWIAAQFCHLTIILCGSGLHFSEPWFSLSHCFFSKRKSCLQLSSFPSLIPVHSSFKVQKPLLILYKFCPFLFQFGSIYIGNILFLNDCFQRIWLGISYLDKKLKLSNHLKINLSFQSPKKAMPSNAQTTTQLHSSHTLAK